MIRKYVTTLFAAMLLCLVPAFALPGQDALDDFHLYDCDMTPEEQTDQYVVDTVLFLFEATEGKYRTVVPDDNGALSIGCLQWNGPRALLLLKDIRKRNPRQAVYYLGEEMAREIQTASEGDWQNRVLTDDEATDMVFFLCTRESAAVQKQQAKTDVQVYLSHGRELGVTDAAALAYYCDVENQYGWGGAGDLLSVIKTDLKKDTVDSLGEMHRGIMKYAKDYGWRRYYTYHQCNLLAHQLKKLLDI